MIKMVTPRGGGPKVVVFLHMIYCTLIDTSEQLVSQRHRILKPGITSSDALPANCSHPTPNVPINVSRDILYITYVCVLIHR